jgi:hypothetical protein
MQLGVDDGVVAADAVGLERLGGWVVVPAATLGEVAVRESAPGRAGVTTALRVPSRRGRSGWANGSQPLKSPTTETLPATDAWEGAGFQRVVSADPIGHQDPAGRCCRIRGGGGGGESCPPAGPGRRGVQ